MSLTKCVPEVAASVHVTPPPLTLETWTLLLEPNTNSASPAAGGALNVHTAVAVLVDVHVVCCTSAMPPLVPPLPPAGYATALDILFWISGSPTALTYSVWLPDASDVNGLRATGCVPDGKVCSSVRFGQSVECQRTEGSTVRSLPLVGEKV